MPDSLDAAITRAAHRRGISKSQWIREAAAHQLRREAEEAFELALQHQLDEHAARLDRIERHLGLDGAEVLSSP